MPLRGLGKAFQGATVVHISDMHLSPIVRERYLLHFVNVINRLEPDFVAITGDFVTGPVHYARRVPRVIRQLRPRIATLACLGNHDYGCWSPNGLWGKPGLAASLAGYLQDANVTLLTNQWHVFRRDGAMLQFVGVEDIWSDRCDPMLAFDGADIAYPTVGLAHNPDIAPGLAALGAQWVLAGHTHGKDTRSGRLRNKAVPTTHRHFVGGEYRLNEGAFLYVNRGIGYSQRLRFHQRPEITLFTLVPAPADA
jgi:predicted MPP superfamily phosphohydrolase